MITLVFGPATKLIVARFSKIKLGARQDFVDKLNMSTSSSDRSVIARLIDCVNFAAEKHKNQRRKDEAQTPYINHPIGVADIIIKEGRVEDPDVLLAAILHDTVEDTATTFQELESHFGHKVTSIVREVTDDKSLPSEERKRLQIEHAPHISQEAKIVKMADKIYNLRDLSRSTPVGWSEKRVAEYFIWAKQVVEACYPANSGLAQSLQKCFESQQVKMKSSECSQPQMCQKDVAPESDTKF